MLICPSLPLSICVQSVFHLWLFDQPAKRARTAGMEHIAVRRSVDYRRLVFNLRSSVDC